MRKSYLVVLGPNLGGKQRRVCFWLPMWPALALLAAKPVHNLLNLLFAPARVRGIMQVLIAGANCSMNNIDSFTPVYARAAALLHKGVRECDPWMDATFPVATGLLCLDARYPAYVLLFLWLVWRLMLQVKRQPLVVVFLLLLGAQAGQFVLERDLQPSSASDPLVIALGFVAMAGRRDAQWRDTLYWVSLCMLPLIVWSLGQDPLQPLDLPVGGINRLGFLLGILQLACWASAWMAGDWWKRCLFAGLAIGSVPMLIQNGSRVGLLAPLVAVLATLVIALAFRPNWLPKATKGLLAARRKILLLVLLLGLASSGVVLRHWYYEPSLAPVADQSPASLNVLSDAGRLQTALCWANQPIRSGGKRFVFGLGNNTVVQRRCDGRKVSSMRLMGRPEGLPHAHNLFAQIFAENGLIGVISLGAVLALLAHKAWSSQASSSSFAARRFFFAVPLLIYFLLNALVSSFQLFMLSNQLLIGLGLATLWSASSAVPLTSALEE
jgi:hypothetical protein